MKPMKKPFLFALILLLVLGLVVTVFADEETGQPQKASDAAGTESESDLNAESIEIQLTIDSADMTVNGRQTAIDESGTAPILRDGRTLLPVRAVVEAMGGTVNWDDATQTATLTRGRDEIRLAIGSTTAYFNNTPEALDVAPLLAGGRTLLPIRFIAESFGFQVGWNEATFTTTITSGLTSSQPGTSNTGGETAQVFMTADISPEGLLAIYDALQCEASGKVAVKISTGEPGGNNFLQPDLIKELVQLVEGTIVESNTAYGGRRSSTALHYQVAQDHGFTAIAPVVILDESSTVSLPVVNGKHLSEDIVGAHFPEYDFHIVLSHFKGHAMGGFGGAIKNMSIGYASSSGKNNIHSAGASTTGWGASQDDFLESMAEAASAIVDAVGEDNILYINVLNNLSVDCDCDSSPAAPEIHDIGILASLDPVALDRASVDLIYAADDSESASLKARIESRNGVHTLDYAAEIGLGSLAYNLVSIDD